jgi:hypothetical protein
MRMNKGLKKTTEIVEDELRGNTKRSRTKE